jgi:stage V sporulation protein K
MTKLRTTRRRSRRIESSATARSSSIRKKGPTRRPSRSSSEEEESEAETTSDEYVPPSESSSDSEDEEEEEEDEGDDDIDIDNAVLLGLISHLIGKSAASGETITPLVQQPPAKMKRHQPRKNEVAPPFIPTSLKELIVLSTKSVKSKFRDCELLSSLLRPLQDLDSLVGMETLKLSITEFVLMQLQQGRVNMPNMRHIILTGSPGCGKTTVAGILGRIVCRLGGMDADHVIFGTQGNMIGEYLGQTAPKTEALIRKAFGGVLVLDEASSLADGRSPGQEDSFSKSCIDTLNRMLSEHGEKFVCILAGYKTEILRDILSINPGMSRRFSIRFELDNYSASDLRNITLFKLTSEGHFTLCQEAVECLSTEWFKRHILHFKNFGGDCETLVACITRLHCLRVFGQPVNKKSVLTMEDVRHGMERHLTLLPVPKHEIANFLMFT